jgi:hypothetical protein
MKVKKKRRKKKNLKKEHLIKISLEEKLEISGEENDKEARIKRT